MLFILNALTETRQVCIIISAALLSIVAWRLYPIKTEIIFLKNFNSTILILGALVAAYCAYDKFIYEAAERKNHPPVLNIDCKLEKIAEEDSCCWVKASVVYENKSDRRIYIFLSTINLLGVHVKSLSEPSIITSPREALKGNSYHSKDYFYLSDTTLLHSQKTDDNFWYDSEQKATRSYIFKVPNGYDVGRLTADVFLANEDKKNIDTNVYQFKTRINTAGAFYVECVKVYTKTTADESTLYELSNKYGYSYTYSHAELYLKKNARNNPLN
jgi:hypothetical protein